METLTYRNNWEKYEYLIDGTNETANIGDIEVVKIGGIEFPVKTKNDYRTVHDMGHTYTAKSVLAYITVDTVVGKTNIPLHEIKRRINVVKRK